MKQRQFGREKLTYMSVAIGTVGSFTGPFAPILEVAAGALGGIAFAHDQKRARLEAGCKLELMQAAQQPNGDSGTGGGLDSGGSGASPGVMQGAGCKWQWSSVNVVGGGVPTDSGWHYVCPPIVLDLDGDGVEYKSLNAPVLMDEHGDGRYENGAWIGSDDGVLIYDANGDGVGQHNEWVLTSFVHGAETDLEALKAFDSNGDGRFNSSDDAFANFKVGRDLNQNGEFEANEVRTLTERGIRQINLVGGIEPVSTTDAPAETAPGIFTFNTGRFVRTDGTVGDFADVALEKTPYAEEVLSNSTVTVVSLGSVNA